MVAEPFSNDEVREDYALQRLIRIARANLPSLDPDSPRRAVIISDDEFVMKYTAAGLSRPVPLAGWAAGFVFINGESKTAGGYRS